MFLKNVCYFLLLQNIFCSVKSHRNNVCKNYIDYFFIDFSPRCSYNPDLYAQVPEILDRHIGFHERYKVVTEDGYILTVFRIPHPKPKGVILLQHPVTTDSIVWVGQGTQSLAYFLYQEGYDVWLPNHRGTYFSREHLTMTYHDFKYWDYSFHEIGLYDLKAEIDLVKKTTNSSDIIFIGHSMGTTAGMIYAALRSEEAKKSIKVFIHICPSAYFKDMSVIYTSPAMLEPLLRPISKILGIGVISQYDAPRTKFLRALAIALPFKFLFPLGLSVTTGGTPNEFDPSLVNVYFSQNPRAITLKILYHYFQLIKSDGDFRMYDYGKERNIKLYGTERPSEYPIKNIKVPTYLIYSRDDIVSSPENVELLYRNLPSEATVYGKLKITGFNHVDFHVGKDRKTKVFDKIIALLDKI